MGWRLRIYYFHSSVLLSQNFLPPCFPQKNLSGWRETIWFPKISLLSEAIAASMERGAILKSFLGTNSSRVEDSLDLSILVKNRKARASHYYILFHTRIH